jgi:predicted DNA-binding transcriptional regulator AlpA
MDDVTTDVAVESPAGATLPLLLDAAEAARLLGVGRTTFYQLDVTGRVPRAIRLSKIRRWSRPELRRWVDAGCPPREHWERAR